MAYDFSNDANIGTQVMLDKKAATAAGQPTSNISSANVSTTDPSKIQSNVMSELSKMQGQVASQSSLSSAPYNNQVSQAQSSLDAAMSKPMTNVSAPTTDSAATADVNAAFDKNSIESDPMYKLLEDRRTEIQKEQEQWQDFIKQDYDRRSRTLAASQKAEKGANMMALARGGALGTSGSGISYMSNLQASHDSALNDIQQERNLALFQAQQGASAQNAELMAQSIARADKLEKDFYDAQSRRLDNIVKYRNIQKLEKEDFTDSLTSFAAAGKSFDELPDDYVEMHEKAAGMAPGTGKAIFEVTKSEYDIKKQKSTMELQTQTLQNAAAIVSIQEKVPRGQEFKVGDATYVGTSVSYLKSGVEIDDKGNGVYYEFDPYTKKASTYSLGRIGSSKEGWQLQFDGVGNPFKFNPSTGEMKFVGKPTDWQELMPEGTVGGQCGAFVNDLTGLGVGDTLASKLAKTDPALKENPDNLQIGDTFVQAIGGWTGHVGVINNITDVGGRKLLTLTESNYHKDQRITHTRQIFADDPTMKGYAPTHDKVATALQSGTDTPTFQPKPTDTDKKGESLLTIDELQKVNAGLPKDKQLKYGTTHDDLKGMDLQIQPKGNDKFQKMSDTAKTDFIELLGMQQIIKNIKELKANVNTGLYNSAKQKGKGLANKADPNFVDLEALTEDLKSMVMKQRSGAAVGEAEVRRLTQFLPSTSDQDQKFERNLKLLEDKFTSTMSDRAKIYGFDDVDEFRDAFGLEPLYDRSAGPEGGESLAAPVTGTGKVMGPDGKTYSYDLSKPDQRDEYDAAIAAGWKQK